MINTEDRLEKTIVNEWMERQSDIIHPDYMEGQIADRDEVVGQENVSKHADRLVALSTMGFSKAGNKSMSLHEMVDLAANKDTTIGTSDWSAETSISKISDRIGTMSLQDFKNNNVDRKIIKQLEHGDMPAIERMIASGLSIEEDGNRIPIDLSINLKSILLPIAKRNAAEVYKNSIDQRDNDGDKTQGQVLDQRIEGVGY